VDFPGFEKIREDDEMFIAKRLLEVQKWSYLMVKLQI